MRIIYLFLFAALLFAGCGSDRSKEEQAIKDVINKNNEAENNEDINAYMQTIDKENKNYDQLEEIKSNLYGNFDLNYQVKDVKITQMNDNEAKVQFVQIVKKIKGPSFRDYRLEGIHTMHKIDGQWKIYDTKITNKEYL
ncbi:MAG TPA: hypothetical protein VLB50_09540 [Ignavibacteriaceae bacterium]|nr:hypothetical protein [Ignavibacteriaceae bacterium]